MKLSEIYARMKSVGRKGFTLIEILVVIGIIAILASVVIVAINPARQFAQARNSQREANVNTILNAIGQNMADHKGVFGGKTGDNCHDAAGDIPNVDPMDPGNGDEIGTSADVDLSCLAPTYIASSIPFDPEGDEDNTLYTIQVDDAGRYTVCAPKHEEAAIEDSEVYCLTR